jgi:hypothetical protein
LQLCPQFQLNWSHLILWTPVSTKFETDHQEFGSCLAFIGTILKP